MNYKLLQSLIGLMLVCSIAYGQKALYLKGYVRDADGPIVGATIWIEGTQKGTTTNVNGFYELYFDAKANISLSFSCIGKKTETRIYKGQSELNVELKDDLLMLSEVQITAKPNINEIDVRAKTGSIDVVPVDKIRNSPVSSITLALQGKVAGLQILNRGELGTLPQIRIRGNSSFRKGDVANQPLYILDGKMIPAETFFYLNPEDIKEMKVLKDAVASALYGIKAANGVIEITSQRGGCKSLSYHMQSGLTLVAPLKVKMMNSAEKLELERLLKNEATPGYMYSEEYIRKRYGDTDLAKKKLLVANRMLDSLRRINTDWHKELARMQSFQKHDLSYRNGNDKMSYLFSLGYLHQGGQLEGNELSRLSTRIALDQALSSKAIATLSINGSYAKTKTPNGSSFSPEQLIYKLNPYESKTSNRLYSYPKRSFSDLFNQFSKERTTKNVGVSLSVNWEVNSALNISAVSGVDFSLDENTEITPATAISEIGIGKPQNARGVLKQSKNTMTNITSNIRINYEKSWGNHDVTLGANADNYTTIVDNLNIKGNGLYGNMRSAGSIDNLLEGGWGSIVGGEKQTNRNLGFGGLVGYTYNDIYNLFATYKLDAASVLPKSKRWNAAWAIGGSLDIKSYPFFKNIDWLSSLSVRGSWGYTANAQGIIPSLITTTFKYSSGSYNDVRLMEVMALPNKNLKAEQNEIVDLGFLATIKKTSISFSAYRRTTRDALLSVPIASSSGFVYQLQNVGVLENRGIEIGFNQDILISNSCNLRLGGNMSYNENKVLDLYGKQRVYTGETLFPDYEVGESTDAVYGLRSTNINPITGLPEFINSEGKQVDAYTRMKREDFVYLGKSTPPVNGNVFLNINYKKLQVGMDFYYSLGGIARYSSSYIRNSDDARFNAAKAQLQDMWWQLGDENKKYPNPFTSSSVSNNIFQPSDKNTMKTDFLRFSNLSIKYQLNTRNLPGFMKKVRYMTLGVNASNLMVFSNYKDSDPETSSILNPLPPTITFNLNVTF